MVRQVFLPLALVIVLAGPTLGQGPSEGELQPPNGVVTQLYPLTEQQGPIMVNAASFVGDDGAALANALAKELREKHRIEAYTYSLKRKPLPQMSEQERQAFAEKYKVRPPVYKLQHEPPENWVVLAGSFPSFESREADRLLRRIRKIDPASVPAALRTSMQFRRDGENPGLPLESAMLVRSPLRPEAPHREPSPQLLRMLRELNDDEFSIYKLNSPYTIRVAQFTGYSVLVDPKRKKPSESLFGGLKKEKSGLERAAQNAVVLTDRLRQLGYEAYVFHGKHASLVCVGGYDSPTDSRLKTDIEKLAKTKVGEFALAPSPLRTPKRPY